MSIANGGRWAWYAYATEIADNTNVKEVCSGAVQVYAGVTAADTAAVDNRTPAEIQLAAIDAALAADGGMVVEYEISTPAGSRRVKKSRKDLLEERKYWAGMVSRERLAAGGQVIGRSQVRMPGC